MNLRNIKTIESHAVDGGNLLYREETLSDGSKTYSVQGFVETNEPGLGLEPVLEIFASSEGNAATIWNALLLATDIRFEEV